MRVRVRPRRGACAAVCDRFTMHGAELGRARQPFIICLLTTREIQGITFPFSFSVKFSPYLYPLSRFPRLFPPPFLCGLVSAAPTSPRLYADEPPLPFHPFLTPLLALFFVGPKGAGTEGKEWKGEEVCGEMRGFKCFHSCFEHWM